jgi:predicted O-methyltransferase YrrM
MESRRVFDYDRRLLPNPYVGELDPANGRAYWERTGQSPGYPAWNLLYYALLCSVEVKDPVVVETGTNFGLSTIVMAQALKDLGAEGKLQTIEVGPRLSEAAQQRVRDAGLRDYVDFHVGDSLAVLSDLAEQVDGIDFIFLDDDHEAEHVIRELQIVCPLVTPRGGKVYFDNTASGGVAQALEFLTEHYGGNLVRFANCSLHPPGNAIWQP